MKSYIQNVLFFFLLVAFLVTGVFALPETTPQPVAKETGEIVLNSKVTAVTVYRDRAMVTRTAYHTLNRGKHVLIFDDVPDDTIKESIQVDGRGNITLKDIKFREVTEPAGAKKKSETFHQEHKRLTAEINELEDKIKLVEKQREFLEKIIDKITHTSADDKSGNAQLNPDSWIKMVDFYRTKNEQLDKESRKYKKIKFDKSVELQIISEKISDLGDWDEKWKKQIVAIVNQTSPGKVKLTLSYIVKGPRWYPVYDLRISSVKKNIDIVYNAMIKQNTGEDWNRAEINLSTANPVKGGSHPNLTPWYAAFVQTPLSTSAVARNKSARGNSSMENAYTLDGVNMMGPVEYAGNVPMSEKVLDEVDRRLTSRTPKVRMIKESAMVLAGDTASVVFNLKGKKSIASDNQDHKTTITTQSFPVRFRYSTVPKLSSNAFLKTYFKNDTDYPLLPGKSNVFLDNAFVTVSRMPHIVPDQETWVFAGADDNIKVDYKFINKSKGKTGFFKGKGIVNFESIIDIANNKKETVEIVVWDQLPISKHEDINVKLIAPEDIGANPNIKMNKQKYVEWLYHLKPGQKIKIPFRFSITYPKNKQIMVR